MRKITLKTLRIIGLTIGILIPGTNVVSATPPATADVKSYKCKNVNNRCTVGDNFTGTCTNVDGQGLTCVKPMPTQPDTAKDQGRQMHAQAFHFHYRPPWKG